MSNILNFDHPYLAEIAEYSRELTARHKLRQVTPPLKDIVAVGSLCDVGEVKGIGIRDQFWLRSSLDACRENCLGLAPNFTLQQPNPHVNKIDILAPNSTVTADVLVICYVPTKEYIAFSHEYGFFQDPAPDPYGAYAISPYDKEDNAWQLAAKRTGARMIVTFSNDPPQLKKYFPAKKEVNSAHFTGGDYIFWDKKDVTFDGHNYRDIPLEYTRDIVFRRDLYDEVKRRQHLARYTY